MDACCLCRRCRRTCCSTYASPTQTLRPLHGQQPVVSQHPRPALWTLQLSMWRSCTWSPTCSSALTGGCSPHATCRTSQRSCGTLSGCCACHSCGMTEYLQATCMLLTADHGELMTECANKILTDLDACCGPCIMHALVKRMSRAHTAKLQKATPHAENPPRGRCALCMNAGTPQPSRTTPQCWKTP